MASKRRQRRKVCGDKIRYRTEGDARAAGHALNRWHYRCQFCGAFHIGNPPAKVRIAASAAAKARRRATADD